MDTGSSRTTIGHTVTEVFPLEVEITSEDMPGSQDSPQGKYGSISAHTTGRGNNKGGLSIVSSHMKVVVVVEFLCFFYFILCQIHGNKWG